MIQCRAVSYVATLVPFAYSCNEMCPVCAAFSSVLLKMMWMQWAQIGSCFLLMLVVFRPTKDGKGKVDQIGEA